MPWTPLWFGKHEGYTLPQVVLSDPDWFFWAIGRGVFKDKDNLSEESIEVDRKARHIRIPCEQGEDLVAEYTIHPGVNKFCDLEIIPRDKPRHQGSSPTERSDVIDLSLPRKYASYDKYGCWKFISAVKSYIFKNSKYRLTKGRCEEFFNNDSNFDLLE